MTDEQEAYRAIFAVMDPQVYGPPIAGAMGLKRTGRIKPINRKRKAKNWERAYGSKAFVQWISRLPCWACNYAGPSPRQAAHTTTGGMGRKADANTIIALCNVCHSKQHTRGWLSIGMTDESKRRAAEHTQTMWEARRGDTAGDEADTQDAGDAGEGCEES